VRSQEGRQNMYMEKKTTVRMLRENNNRWKVSEVENRERRMNEWIYFFRLLAARCCCFSLYLSFASVSLWNSTLRWKLNNNSKKKIIYLFLPDTVASIKEWNTKMCVFFRFARMTNVDSCYQRVNIAVS
jgi:hypothetical protein